jgi:hypothetical protein
VDLLQVDVVGLKALEAGVNGVHDVAAGCAYIVSTGAYATVNLGGDDDVFASDTKVFERLAESGFGAAFRVDIGSIEKVDAGVERGLDEFVRACLPYVADGLPDGAVFGEGCLVVSGDGHGSKAESRDKKAGVAKRFVFHWYVLGPIDRR